MAPIAGKFWLTQKAELKFVCKINENFTHEEFANKMNLDLEDLLNLGWIRIQNVPPSYFYADSIIFPNKDQQNKILEFLNVPFEKILLEFDKQVFNSLKSYITYSNRS